MNALSSAKGTLLANSECFAQAARLLRSSLHVTWNCEHELCAKTGRTAQENYTMDDNIPDATLTHRSSLWLESGIRFQ
jgi:hypothetical protein